jgi:hypothetical protein
MNQHETSRPTYEVKMLIYQVSSLTHRQKKGTLADRGVNGGLAGGDLMIVRHTALYVNVKGIDGHTVDGLELVTVAGLVISNVGP